MRKEEKKRDRKLFRGKEMVQLRQYLLEKRHEQRTTYPCKTGFI